MIKVRPWVRLTLVLAAKFFIAMGTAVSAAMVQAGKTVWPDPAVYLLGFIIGFVAAWEQLYMSLEDVPDKVVVKDKDKA